MNEKPGGTCRLGDEINSDLLGIRQLILLFPWPNTKVVRITSMDIFLLFLLSTVTLCLF